MLTNLIKQSTINNIEAEHIAIAKLCVEYLTARITAFIFQHKLKNYSLVSSPKIFRLQLLTNKYYFLSIKLFLMACSKEVVICRQTFKDKAVLYGISKRDSSILFDLYFKDKGLSSYIKNSAKPFKTIPLPKEVDEEFTNVYYKPILKYIQYRCFKKLRFLSNGTNHALEDFHGEVLARAIQVYYQQVPTVKSELHILNYLKTSVKNYATNIIYRERAAKRDRVTESGLIVISENKLHRLEEKQTTYDELGSVSPIEKLELRLSVQKILKVHGTTKSKTRMLHILLGKEDKEFTEWLQKNKLANRKETNTEVQVRVNTLTYRNYLADFFNIPITKLGNFLTNVGNSLQVGNGNELPKKQVKNRRPSNKANPAKPYFNIQRKTG